MSCFTPAVKTHFHHQSMVRESYKNTAMPFKITYDVHTVCGCFALPGDMNFAILMNSNVKVHGCHFVTYFLTMEISFMPPHIYGCRFLFLSLALSLFINALS